MLWPVAERGMAWPRSNVPVPSPCVPSTLPSLLLVLVLVMLFEMLLASARRAPLADSAPDAAAVAAAGARVTAALAAALAAAVARPIVTAGLAIPEEASSSVLYSPSDGPPDDVAERDAEFLERYE